MATTVYTVVTIGNSVTYGIVSIGNSTSYIRMPFVGLGLGKSPLGKFPLGDPFPGSASANIGTGKFYTRVSIAP